MKALQSKLDSESKRKGSKILNEASRRLVATRGAGFEKTRAQFERQVLETASGFNAESKLNSSLERLRRLFGSYDAEGIRALCIILDGVFSSDPKSKAAQEKIPR